MTHPADRRFSLPLAILIALLAGAAYGASSALLPFIKLNLVVLLGGVVLMFTAFARLRKGGFLGLIGSLIAGALAVSAMWLIWYGLEFGFDRLIAIFQQGPKAIWQTVQSLSNMSMTVTMNSNTFTHSAAEVSTVWLLQTAAMGLSPVLGALVSLRRSARAAVI